MVNECYERLNELQHMNGRKILSSTSGSLVLLTLLLTGLVVALFHNYLSLNSVYLFKDAGGDSINIVYSTYYLLSRIFKETLLPSWSFNVGLGQDILPLSLGNIFEYPFYLIHPDKIAFLLIYVEVAKIAIVAWLFFALCRNLALAWLPALIGAMMLSFSGYMIVGGQWSIFSTEMVHLVLLLFSVEQYLAGNRRWPVVLATALMVAANPFELYTSNLIVMLFLVLRGIVNDSALAYRFRQLAGILLLEASGCCLAAIFFLPNLHGMINSPRGFGGVAYQHITTYFADGLDYYLTLALRLVSSNILGTGSNFTGWENYVEAPMVSVGLIALLCVPLFFYDNLKNRAHLAAVTIIALLTCLPVLRYAIWLFRGNYFRALGLLIILYAVVATVKTIQGFEKKAPNLLLLLAVYGACAALLFIDKFVPTTLVIDNNQRYCALGFLSIYLLVMILFSVFKRPSLIKYAILLLLPMEIVALGKAAVNNREVVTAAEIKQGRLFNDNSSRILESIRSTDDSFYRIWKDFSSTPARGSSLNDSMVQGYYGITAYGRFNHLNTVNFMDSAGVIDKRYERRTRWLTGIESSPVLMNVVNVKYILCIQDAGSYKEYGFVPLYTDGGVTVLVNSNYLPFGYSYDHFLDASSYRRMKPEQRHAAMMKGCVTDDRMITAALAPVGETFEKRYSVAEMHEDGKKLRESALKISRFEQSYISGAVVSDRSKLLLLAMPYDSGWQITLNGNRVNAYNVNGGLTGILINAGINKVEMHYKPHLFQLGLAISCISGCGLFFAFRKWDFAANNC